ncbi:N5-carboxyaminoimidazole ribonucleotide mutase [bacterium HR17]|uniref:N5-carboxyaminoimidazole ribonucleotide mutase n=1 Tax=Candidatus Fervidibacter japonicus TaxID=2035412 RepID=A0A2H5X8R5_9BACT|nr:N5-carboxyaminoimidazole ribonucleotide mutase [bacterium HR17]
MLLQRLRQVLERVRAGDLSVDEALQHLRTLPFEDLGFAKIDHHRLLRRGFPEAVYCLHKTPEQVQRIVAAMAQTGATVIATKASAGHYEAVRQIAPQARYHETARLIAVEGAEPTPLPAEQQPHIAVLCAGTADLPIAEEAALTAEYAGCRVSRVVDVGVAGIHRLLDHRAVLETAQVLVVVAGMEGALPSVVAGLMWQPVIAVPTSVGYGANFHGLSALLTMLNACAPGIAVVNIDNGFGAGYLAALIGRMAKGAL